MRPPVARFGSRSRQGLCPQARHTKEDLARYYVEAAEGVLVGRRERPTTLKRFVDGAAGELFVQMRVPKAACEWLETGTDHFCGGAAPTEFVANDAAHLVWIASF